MSDEKSQGNETLGQSFWGRIRSAVRARPPVPPARDAPDCGVEYVTHDIPPRLPAGIFRGCKALIRNTGARPWLRDHPEGKRVDLVVRLDGNLQGTYPMPRAQIDPGECATVHFPVHVTAAPRRYRLTIDLVEQNVAVFSERGIAPLTIDLFADERMPDVSSDLFIKAQEINPWHYQPSRGVSHSHEGKPFPRFVSRAKGCQLWDPEGNSFTDYIMGWGSALLGYADDRIRDAIAQTLDTAPLTPFPSPLEMETAQMLVEDFNGAQMAVFGKNGSDVCTVAARLARAFTGKRIILYSGYHGWQDFWAEQSGFQGSGIPERPSPLIHRFRFNDREDFRRLYEVYRHDLAAVMLEPSGPGESVQGPAQDADPLFLALVAEAARDARALLVFDEIMTGFRYPSGSVQKAFGVVPDLTCLGKALAAGMPLSALIGKADIFQRAMHRTHYGPTFKGEIYSFAAAKAAMTIYRKEPVAQHVWDYGTRLKDGLNRICRRIGLAVECKGPPFRMAIAFDEPDPDRLRMKRTLYQQELMKCGITTYNGIMIPSYAHTEAVLKETLSAAECALRAVDGAERENNLEGAIELPLLP